MAKELELRKLTPKQERFVEEYLVDLNGTQAAIRAGYSKNSADVIAAENLVKPNIQVALQAKREEVSQKTMVDLNWVINALQDNLRKANEKDDLSAANKSIELIGKTFGAFTDNIKHEGHLNIAVKNYTRD